MKQKKGLMDHPCPECLGTLEKKTITQEFEREGVKVRLSGITAWVCSGCGETYFPPGWADKVVKAANCLFELALTEKQHKGTLIAQSGLLFPSNRNTASSIAVCACSSRYFMRLLISSSFKSAPLHL
ncbi:MAG: YgiT-type zinc finger protein [Nitrospira sp.]|nr:YgiT-type zinc finger protein [Nitrospira sp.]